MSCRIVIIAFHCVTRAIYSYVAAKVEEDDISWIPKGVAIGVPDLSAADTEQSEQRMMDNIK